MLLLVAVPLASSPPVVPRWSAAGHEVICGIAWTLLSDDARTLVGDVAGLEERGDFAASCVWADQVRRTTHRHTSPYHYVNIPRKVSGFEQARDCPGPERCVTWAVVRYADVLQDRAASREARGEALKLLAHFIGDLHQPLHAGYADDLGGNRTHVDFFGAARNLHAVWDGAIVARGGYAGPTAAQRLHDAITPAQAAEWQGFDPEAWTNESYEIVESMVYGFPTNGEIDREYFVSALEISLVRIQQAGVRLAFTLNQIATGALSIPH
jgi:hypothetical protein